MNDKTIKADLMVVQLDRARTALAEAKTIGETKKIMDMAHAAQIYARRQQLGEEAMAYALAIKIEALRKLGEILQVTPRHAGGKPVVGDDRLGKPPTLKELTISRDISVLAQKLAAMPDAQFEQVREGVQTVSEAMKTVRAAKTKAAVEAVQKEAPAKRQDQLRTVKLGDVWQLGRHLLYCGDTSKPPFEKLIKPAALCFADPPYGVGTDGYDDSKFYWQHDHLMDACDVMVVTPGIENIFRFARLTNMPYRWALSVWFSNGMTRGAIGFGNWAYAAVFSHGSIHRGAQDFTKITIDISTTKETDHPTRKPTQFIVWVVELFSKPGQLVLDPFLGSGTTLLACEQLDRTCIGGELDPLYCADIIRRWEGMTDKKAVRA